MIAGRRRKMIVKQIPIVLCLFLLFSPTARSQTNAGAPGPINCLDCHSELAPEKGAHPAVAMGCPSCHTGIDASDIPHKILNKHVKGLSAEQPDLCFGCHDKSLFEKKVVHAAVGMGCTGCHNAHASKNPKLLRSDVPDACYACHEKKAFEKKNVHPPVESGMCTACHSPHAANEAGLLLQPAAKLCGTCHEKQLSGRHVMSGFGPGGSHPVAGKADPSDPRRELSCTSCHVPHASAGRKLMAKDAAGPADLCTICHTRIRVPALGP